MTLCECGCGGKVTDYKYTTKRFISGHNGRGRRKPPATFQCVHCGKANMVMPHLGVSRLGAARKFCDALCRDTYRREKTGVDHPRYTPPPTYPCTVCGTVCAKRWTGKKTHYCSNECGAIAKSRKLRAALAARYADRLVTIKNQVRSRDGDACRLCAFDIAIHVHHIIGKAHGGKDILENLISLCPNHHAMAHAGLLTRAALRDAITKSVQYKLDGTKAKVHYKMATH